MATSMRVELVSPERVLYSGEATMVIVRALEAGEVAFLPNHAPFLAALVEHVARIFPDDGPVMSVAVHGGFVEVSNNKVSILSDVAELANQIDVGRAEQARAAAETALTRQPDDVEAAAALRRANARLAAAGAPASAAAVSRAGAH